MDVFELPEVVHHWANDILVWIGFGTVVGLVARALMPGRDQGGAVTTLLMGIGGTVIGSGTLMFFWEGHRVTPVSPAGFLVATCGAFILLFFHRLLGGYFFPYRERAQRLYIQEPHHKHAHVEKIIKE